MSNIEQEELRKEWENANQGHVFAYWEKLSEEEKEKFSAELKKTNVEQVKNMFAACEKIGKVSLNEANEISPLPLVTKIDSIEQKQHWEKIGLSAIYSQKIAVILLAGGQGTRLGYDHPKGMFSIGLPSNKSLFQLQAERIRKVVSLSNENERKNGENSANFRENAKVFWYIMTSDSTDDETRSYFEENQFFGMSKEEVVFFRQSTLPATSPSGSLLLSSPSSLINAPNGNGGLYGALVSEGILSDMQSKGVEVVFVYGVDNVLVKIADPVFLGSFIESKAEVGSKVVPKSNPDERVGVLCLRNGKYEVVEYSEISSEMAHQRDEKGNLLFNAANIVTHIFTIGFLEKFTKNHLYDLKYHLAVKDIPSLDIQTGKMITQKGYKYEQFIFDSFIFADSLFALEVEREEEFSALKNKEGSDSPITALLQTSRVAKKYIREAGGVIENDADDLSHVVEISPLISYAGENLSSLVDGKTFSAPFELK